MRLAWRRADRSKWKQNRLPPSGGSAWFGARTPECIEVSYCIVPPPLPLHVPDREQSGEPGCERRIRQNFLCRRQHLSTGKACFATTRVKRKMMNSSLAWSQDLDQVAQTLDSDAVGTLDHLRKGLRIALRPVYVGKRGGNDDELLTFKGRFFARARHQWAVPVHQPGVPVAPGVPRGQTLNKLPRGARKRQRPVHKIRRVSAVQRWETLGSFGPTGTSTRTSLPAAPPSAVPCPAWRFLHEISEPHAQIRRQLDHPLVVDRRVADPRDTSHSFKG